MAACSPTNPLVLHKGFEFSTTAYRRLKDQVTVVPIPTTFEARMTFTAKFGDTFTPLVLTSNPAAGLTLNRPLGSIAIYIGATVTAALTLGLQLNWELNIYDPLNPDAVVFLGSGTATVES